MLAFLLYTLVLIGIGIFIRIFWIPLMFIGATLLVVLGIIVSAGFTAFLFALIHAVFNNGEYTGFSTYFMYCLVFFTVATAVYGAIVSDIFEYGIGFIKEAIGKK